MNNYVLLNHLNQILEPQKFEDYCPNGLQIEGDCDIRGIVTGVSLCDDLIENAIRLNANAIIVHHGIFWNKDSYTITGVKQKRIARLLKHGINLYAYHLPLDNHLTLGNNIQLANLLDIKVVDRKTSQNLLWVGEFAEVIQLEDLKHKLNLKLKREPLCFAPAKNKPIKTIAWCTGGAANFFNLAIELDVDAYLTGEANEPSKNMASESNVAFIAAGHYATERYGVMALGEYIRQKFGIKSEFIELYNPV